MSKWTELAKQSEDNLVANSLAKATETARYQAQIKNNRAVLTAIKEACKMIISEYNSGLESSTLQLTLHEAGATNGIHIQRGVSYGPLVGFRESGEQIEVTRSISTDRSGVFASYKATDDGRLTLYNGRFSAGDSKIHSIQEVVDQNCEWLIKVGV